MQQKEKGMSKLHYQILAMVVGIAVIIFAYDILWQAITQLFIGMLVAMAALPIMKRFEKKLSTGLSASLAMTSLTVLVVLLVLVMIPPIAQQGKQLIGMLPSVYAKIDEWVAQAQKWLVENGIPIDESTRSSMLQKGQEILSGAAPAAVSWVSSAAASMSKWLLAPVFAFYFLRDRKRIGEWLLMLVPMGRRAMTVKMLREMKRETAGYLRGQLMVSAVVGGLTAVGLLFCGIPAWLLLGLLMGVLELIPYVGPFLGGAMVLLFSLHEGLSRTLWAMGVVLLVQQLEGGMLAPQLMSDATSLHPVVVLLCVMVGGAIGGIGGILLSVPLLLCARAAICVVNLNRSQI